MKIRTLLCAAAVMVAVLAAPARADIINGDFEGGSLNGWTTTGSVSVVAGPLGSNNALVNASGGGSSIANLESFFGLAAGSIAGADLCTPKTCINGVGMFQSVAVSAGTILSFDWWAFLEGSSFYVDAAFLVVGSDIISLANGLTGPKNSAEMGSYTFASAGIFNVGFGVLNGGDGCCGAGLYLDNVATTAAVPEPSMLGLMGMGLIGFALIRRRRHSA